MRRLTSSTTLRVLLCVLPVAGLLLGLVVWIPVQRATAALDREADARVASTSAIAADYVGRRLTDLTDLVRSTALRPTLVTAIEQGDTAAIRTELRIVQTGTPGLRAATLLTGDGRLAAMEPALPGIMPGDDLSHRSYFAGAVDDPERPFVSDAFNAATSGAPVIIAVSMAVRGTAPERPLLGVVVTSFAVESGLQQYVDAFAADERVFLHVADRTGATIAAPATTPADGIRSRKPVGGFGWTVTAVVPQDVAGAAIDDLRHDSAVVAGGIAVLVLGCLLLAARAHAALRNERAALRRSNARFEAMLHAATEHAIVTVDGDGCITEWNEGAERIFGWSRDRAVGRHVPKEFVLDPGVSEGRREWRHVRPDGGEVAVSLTITAMHGPDGERTGLIGIANDVTAHREAVVALVASEAQYRTIVDLADEGILTLGPDGRTTFANARMASLLGCAGEDAVGLTLEEIVATRDGDDCRLVRRDGAEVWVMLRTTPVRSVDGAERGLVAMATDVTERRRRKAELQAAFEQLQELDQVKTDFVSTVSHELRTPLTSIVGYLELLGEGDAGPLAPQQQRMLAVVERNSRRLLDLIEDLLTLSRVESGSFKLVHEVVDVGPLVEGAAAAVLLALRAKGLSLHVDVARDLPAVRGDVAQLERVLLNLLSNAAKFTDQGGSVFVEAQAGNGAVRLLVRDTGMGISPAEQEQLFTRFFRSTQAREQAIQGTGLGLAIVKTIVDHHAGTIRVASAPGEGTTFRIELPAEPAFGHRREAAGSLRP